MTIQVINVEIGNLELFPLYGCERPPDLEDSMQLVRADGEKSQTFSS